MIRWRNCRVRSCSGRPEDPVRRALLEDPAAVEEADPRRDVAGEAHLVGRDDHRHPARGEAADDVEDLGHELRIEGRGHLVEEQHVRLHRQRPDDRHPLLLAARQAVRDTRRACRPARTARGARSPGAPPRRAGAWRTLRGPSVMLSITRMCGNRLKAWNTMPIRRRIAVDLDAGGGDLLVADEDPAGVDRLEQVDAAQERRLAAPRRADEADDLVLGDGQVDARAGRRGRRTTCGGPRCARPGGRPAGAADAVIAAHPASRRRRSRATSQSVTWMSGTVRMQEQRTRSRGRA